MSDVIPFRSGQNVATAHRTDRDMKLGQLEAENSRLRLSAIKLVLEIQELREAPVRPTSIKPDGVPPLPRARRRD
jgi:hypothetical protein